MKIVVMKFGGASVSTPEKFGLIAEIILNRLKGFSVVVVVSAMGNSTDELLALAKKVHPNPPLRELDMLVSVGERISISLLAMALNLKKQAAISFTGSQSGIITSSEHSEARIIEVKPHRLQKQLQENKVVIVAGFQGVSREGEITTLGRGGSDTTAVALAVALGASHVEFYKDVAGIYSEDPKKYCTAEILPVLSYQQALSIVEKGAEVLHARCIRLAGLNHVPIQVRSFLDPDLSCGGGTWIRSEADLGERKCIYE